jgi:hypothetical protein
MPSYSVEVLMVFQAIRLSELVGAAALRKAAVSFFQA